VRTYELKKGVVLWSPCLPFKLGDPGSILGQTLSLKIVEEKESYIDIS
jgi:hypothetical protein